MLETHVALDQEGARGPRIGLAVAGGGPLGGIYELGALRALDEALEGLDFNKLDVYVGVSSGGFISACLANQITTEEMCHVFINNEDIVGFRFTPEIFLKPALLEYFKRAVILPGLVFEGIWRFVKNPLKIGFINAFSDLGRAIPTGIFDNETIHESMEQVFNYEHRTNDFRKLKNKLYLVAVDIDTGETVRFGRPGYDHVPISRAIQASAALPGLFPPVKIDGRYFVDGALHKTMDASTALEQGVDLVICVNPLVPFDASLATKRGMPRHESLVEGGLPAILSQTFRALIYSRVKVGMSRYDTLYPNADVLVFEPNRDDELMFFTNVFSYSGRHKLCEHAYQMTRRDLFNRSDELEPILNRHGITLRKDILADPDRHYCSTCRHVVGDSPSSRPKKKPLQLPRPLNTTVTHKLVNSLDELQQWVGKQGTEEKPYQSAKLEFHS